MKQTVFYTIIIMLSILASCDSEDQTEPSGDVEAYIALLEKDAFMANDLPPLSANAIPYLLKYRNDQTIVTNFPFNPISSYATPNAQYRLGILALWTIESIRMVSIESSNLIQHFPSQNPFIQLKDDPYTWFENHDAEAYQTIRDAYSTWWNENKSKDFESFHHIDPLENTEYRWH